MKTYTIKKLIKGYRVKPSLRDKTLVAIPYNKPISVKYKDDTMDINEESPLLHHETFDDKFREGRKYTLYYYEWFIPETTTQISLF
jgi:hypothetical protein